MQFLCALCHFYFSISPVYYAPEGTEWLCPPSWPGISSIKELKPRIKRSGHKDLKIFTSIFCWGCESRATSTPPYPFLAWYWINPLNVELNPICHLLVLLGAHHILHFSRIGVKRSAGDVRTSEMRAIHWRNAVTVATVYVVALIIGIMVRTVRLATEITR